MLARLYDINLDLPDHAEVHFTLDPNQLDLSYNDLPDYFECRFDTEQEAREVALTAANLVGHEVEVEAYYFHGYYGKDRVGSFVVQPEAWVCNMEQLSLGLTIKTEPEKMTREQKLAWLSANMKFQFIAVEDQRNRLRQLIIETKKQHEK